MAELIGVSSLLKDLHIRKCLSEHLDETDFSGRFYLQREDYARHLRLL